MFGVPQANGELSLRKKDFLAKVSPSATRDVVILFVMSANIEQGGSFNPETHDARLALHLQEYTKCIRWCLDHSAQYHPAFVHKHKAPCDIDNFYFKQTPWMDDGSVNPQGVPPAAFDFDTY